MSDEVNKTGSSEEPTENGDSMRLSRRRLLKLGGISGLAGIIGFLQGCSFNQGEKSNGNGKAGAAAANKRSKPTPPRSVDVDRIAADPTNIPDPIERDEPKHHDITLTAKERIAEIEDGVTFKFMTFEGQVPGPMIRVRQGDTISFTLKNAPDSSRGHNVDLHAVYGTGGGNVATKASPGSKNGMKFKATYPGAFIYHCAVPNLDFHISSGMFGMIVVEPKEGLPPVDKEVYLGQHEVYTDTSVGTEAHHNFDFKSMMNEEPTYVLFNGEKYPFTPNRYGPVTVDQGDRVRVFMVCGGPNYSSNFHPIGNVWSEGYRDGAIADRPEKYLQTAKVPPGSCFVGELDTPVPERIKLVDHALSRVVHRGLLAEIDVQGEERPDLFDPSPDKPSSTDEEGPLY